MLIFWIALRRDKQVASSLRSSHRVYRGEANDVIASVAKQSSKISINIKL
jgi:hypothetical protein